MTKTRRNCRFCGKEFIACNERPPTDTFRWQDFTCSQECGIKYLEKLQKESSQEN